MDGARRHRLAWVAVAVFALLFSLWLHLCLRDMAFDDTWIHLRIARNLLSTGHAWFNTNERVMATSSPLWTLLMAALDMPRWPVVLPVLEALLYWGSCVLASLVAFRSLPQLRTMLRVALTLTAGLVTAVLLVSSSIGQMETPLAIALLLGAWLLALNGNGHALPLLALASLTRLELLPVWLLATIAAVLHNRRRWGKPLLGFVTIAVGALWTLQQFHVLLPNSMRAKQIAYDFTTAQTLHQFVPHRLLEHAFAAVLLWLTAIGAALWWRAGTQGTPRRAAWLALASLGTGLLIIAEYVARRTVVFEWYRPLFLLPLALGVLLLPLPEKIRAGWRVLWAAAQVVILLHLLASPFAVFRRVVQAAASPTIAMKSRVDGGDFARVQEYLQVGAVLNRTCPGQQLMVSEIGGLGWAYYGEVNDGFGIASPAALRYQPLRSGAPKGGIPVAYLLQSKPEVVVSYTVMAVEPLYDVRVQRLYDLLPLSTSPRSHRGGPLDHDWRSSPNLDVWLRRGGPCDNAAVKEALRSQVN